MKNMLGAASMVALLLAVPAWEKEAQDGQSPSVRNFARNLLPTAKEHLAAVQALLATTASK